MLVLLSLFFFAQVKRRPGDAKPAFIEAHMNGHAGKGTESAAAAAPSSHSLAPPAEPSTPAPSSVLRRITVNDIPPLHRDPGQLEAIDTVDDHDHLSLRFPCWVRKLALT